MKIVAAGALLAGCAPASAGGEAGVPGDTLRGTLRVVGSEPATRFVLRPARGDPVTLLGERALLERLAGLEVMVAGEVEPSGRFRVARAAVRAADGVPAVDGVLARDGEGYALVTADGRRLAVGRLPEALRSRVGARVWLAGPLDRPEAFGVITP